MKPIVFASQSRYKCALFRRLDLPFTPATPRFEEYVPDDMDPAPMALFLAEQKAGSLRHAYANHLIISADQVLSLGDQIFTKPENQATAVDQLRQLRGHTHWLHTAYTLLETPQGDAVSRVVPAKLRFYADLPTSFLEKIVARDRTEDCVGGYKFEEHGVLFVESVTTPDTNAILGLPLISLIADLRQRGYFPRGID